MSPRPSILMTKRKREAAETPPKKVLFEAELSDEIASLDSGLLTFAYFEPRNTGTYSCQSTVTVRRLLDAAPDVGAHADFLQQFVGPVIAPYAFSSTLIDAPMYCGSTVTSHACNTFHLTAKDIVPLHLNFSGDDAMQNFEIVRELTSATFALLD